MKIVIDIDDEQVLFDIKSRGLEAKSETDKVIINALYNAIPLPKEHGNLIQRESAEVIFKNARKALYEQSRKEQIKDFQTREMMLLNAEQFVHLIEPIIEADKESESE